MEWHVETAPPCEAHRATSKDVRATVHSSKSNMGLRKMHERGQTQSACLAAACRQSGPEAGRKQLFFGKWRWLGQSWGCGEWCHSRMQFTGFSTNSALTLWSHVGLLSGHSKPQPAWRALSLLLYSSQQLHPFTSHSSCRHSPFSMRTSSWVACARSCQPMAYLACAEGVSFKADSMADLAAKKVESGGDRKRIICPSGRCSEDGSSHRYQDFYCSCWVIFSPYYEATFSGQQELHSRFLWRPPWCFITIITETITSMCLS